MRQLCTFLLLCLLPLFVFSQSNPRPLHSMGLRFATDLNWFQRARDLELVDNGFSTGVLGFFYRVYAERKGVEIGLNINYKDGDGRGFPNLPMVMEDFDPTNTQNVGMTAAELDFKVGPRFGGFHPKIGYILGYRLRRQGFLEPNSERGINSWYFQLPFGGSLALPTSYGSVGFGAYFELDITNVITNDTAFPGTAFRGGRQHAVNIEITVTMDRR
jgi:hypothetical protein